MAYLGLCLIKRGQKRDFGGKEGEKRTNWHVSYQSINPKGGKISVREGGEQQVPLQYAPGTSYMFTMLLVNIT